MSTTIDYYKFVPNFFVFNSISYICRVESFIEHQDACTVRRTHTDLPTFAPMCSSRTTSSTSPSSDTNLTIIPSLLQRVPQTQNTQNNLELQLLPSSSSLYEQHDDSRTNLKLSIGSEISFLKEEEKMKIAKAEKDFAEEARQQAKRQIEIAEIELANAKQIRKQAQAELERAKLLRDEATKKISSTISEITCHSCKQRFQATSNNGIVVTTDEMSSVVTGEGD